MAPTFGDGDGEKVGAALSCHARLLLGPAEGHAATTYLHKTNRDIMLRGISKKGRGSERNKPHRGDPYSYP
jgi:hypothetical protein